MGYRYAQVETAVLRALGVATAQEPMFRARIRHLRKLGIPRIPKPGIGYRVEYEWTQAFELMLALHFEAMGRAPRHAADLALHVIRIGDTGPGDMYVAVRPFLEKPLVDVAFGPKNLLRMWHMLEPRFDGLSLINVSSCSRRLQKELERSTT